MRAHRDGAGAGTAGAVRAGERLVDVVVHHVDAEVAGPGDAEDGVHVGAVEVDQRRRVVDQLGDRRRSASSNRPSVFGLVIMNTAVRSSSLALRSSRSTRPRALLLMVTASKPAMAALAGLVPWALSGMRTRGALLRRGRGSRRRRPAGPSTRPGRRRPAAATRRRGRRSRRGCSASPRAFAACPGTTSSALQRVQVGQARQGRQPFVPLGVVLHRTRPERIEIGVDRHVPRREVDEVADQVDLADFRQRRRRVGQGVGAAAGPSAGGPGTSHCRQRWRAPAGMAHLEQQFGRLRSCP